jgi:cytoskeletal protein CcmA (bactofilin family)
MTESTKPGPGRKTLVEEGTHFKGSLSSNCPIEVKGRVEGDLTAPALAISASGAVHGKVKVGEMRSQGELAGEFDADVVQLSGTVRDNTVIRAKSLEVKLSSQDGKMQVIFGECSLEVGSEAATANVAAPAEAPARAPEPPPKVAAPSVRPPAADANGA